jgi:hypothetical protein
VSETEKFEYVQPDLALTGYQDSKLREKAGKVLKTIKSNLILHLPSPEKKV